MAIAGEQATPLTVEELGALHYASRLETDEQLRDLAPVHARIGMDNGYLADVRAIAAGAASYDLIEGIFGREIEKLPEVQHVDRRANQMVRHPTVGHERQTVKGGVHVAV